jgi:PAS domain S-box-containing protein
VSTALDVYEPAHLTVDLPLPETQSQAELLREVTAILDGAPVGIGYLRNQHLVRYNLRFERMLGFGPNATAEASLTEILLQGGLSTLAVSTTMESLAAGHHCDVELALPASINGDFMDQHVTWCALSLRRAEHDGHEDGLVAVLTDITRLKRQQAETERALHERELMFNQSDVGIAWLQQGCIVRANSAMSELTGLGAQALVGRSMDSLFAPGDVGPLDEEVQHNLAAHGRHVSEQRLLRSDGSLRWTQVSQRAVDPADPDSDHVCSFVDVDERQHSREALQQQAGHTRAVLDSVLVGIVTVGERGIEWMNRSARRMFGGELEAFIGEPIGCVATPEPEHPLSRVDWLQRLEDGESEIFECRLQARDGRAFWVVGNAVATPREAGQGRQVTFALLDIEARRQAEVRVSSARASLQRLIETAPLAIALFDDTTLQMVEGNNGAELFFGRPLQQLLGSGPDACLSDSDQAAALRASLELARDTPQGVRREVTRPGRSAEPLRWDARFVMLGPQRGAASDDGAAEAGQILMVANDVTELRRAEQARLDQAIAQREMLVKEVHHRIKNNLQGVAGLLQQTAQRRPEISNPLQEAIGQVQAIAQVYGLQVGAEGPLDLLGMLRAIAGTVQRSLHHVVETSFSQDAAAVRWMLPEAESIPLALTLNELLTNAVRHGDSQPVQCLVRSAENEVCIEISNGGQLPTGFELQRVPAGMAGLGLVRALLPRRAAVLAIQQQGERVLTSLTLRPPSVRPAAAVAVMPPSTPSPVAATELRHNAPVQAQAAMTA